MLFRIASLNICLFAVLCGAQEHYAQTTNGQSLPSLESLSPDKKLETPRALTEWDLGNIVSIDSSGKNTEISYVYQIKDLNNILITAKGKSAGQNMDGQMMLIEGRWMLVKNMPLVKGYELDDLDGPLLKLKLAFYLLSSLVTAGPSEIRGRSTLKLKDQKKPFIVATLSASAAISTPWSLNAVLEPVAPNKFSFDMNLKAHPSVRLMGMWQKDPSLHVVDDDMPLDGWQIYSIGVATEKLGVFMRSEIMAKQTALHPKNLGELRQLIEK